MKLFIKYGILAVIALFSLNLSAKVVVVVHPSNAATLSQEDINRIFLGKSKSFPGGELAVPVNQSGGSAAAEAFNTTVIKKSSSQLKAYWSKLVFSGKGTPPKEVGSDADVKSLVANNPNLIGYIDEASVDSTVKVIGSF